MSINYILFQAGVAQVSIHIHTEMISCFMDV